MLSSQGGQLFVGDNIEAMRTLLERCATCASTDRQ
jgi:hypothetical protein